MGETKNTSNGLSFATVLFLIFLTLKLAEIGPVQHWSWWWVTAPLWLPIILVLSFLLIVATAAFIGHLIKD